MKMWWRSKGKSFWIIWIAVAGLLCSVTLGVSEEASVAAAVEPLLQQSDLTYIGSFKLPRSAGDLSDFQYGGASVAFNPANESLFIQGRGGNIAEIGIPLLTTSPNYNELATGAVLQPFAPLDDQRVSFQNNPSDVFIRGLLVDQGELVASFASWYDANYEQTTSHLVRPLNLGVQGQTRGPFKVGSVMPGHVAGHMTSIPTEWRSSFAATALTGNFGLPIVTRESWGPAAYVFSPAQLGLMNPAPAIAVVDYPDNTHSLGPWDNQSDVWNSTSTFSGLAFVQGTRSVLFFGTHGRGAFCYGDGGATNPNNGEPWCYDPEAGDKGTHAYPYTYRVWAYDANDLLAVKLGTKNTWEPRPYGVWDLTLPMSSSIHKMPSVTYDAASQRFFVVQGFSPSDGPEGFPVVHVYSTVGYKGRPNAPNRVRLILP